MEGYLSSMVRTADAAVLMVDLGDDDGPFAAETVLRTPGPGQDRAGRPSPRPDRKTRRSSTSGRFIVANKIDLPGAADRLEIVREMFGPRFPIHVLVAEHGDRTGRVAHRPFIAFLNVIRVYTKQPGKPPDMTSPVHVPVGSTLVEMAALVHRDFADNLKSARIWGTGVFDGQTVKRDHVLHDKDVVELHK